EMRASDCARRPEPPGVCMSAPAPPIPPISDLTERAGARRALARAGSSSMTRARMTSRTTSVRTTSGRPALRSLQDGIARTLLAAIEADLAAHGARALATLRRRNPGDYLDLALQCVPPEGEAAPPERNV